MKRFSIITPTVAQAQGGSFLYDSITREQTGYTWDKEWIAQMRLAIKACNYERVIQELYYQKPEIEMTLRTYGVFEKNKFQVYKIKARYGKVTYISLLCNGTRGKINKFLKANAS